MDSKCVKWGVGLRGIQYASGAENVAGEDASYPGQFKRLDQITSTTNERLRPTRRIASASIIARLLTTKRLLPSEKIALRSVHH